MHQDQEQKQHLLHSQNESDSCKTITYFLDSLLSITANIGKISFISSVGQDQDIGALVFLVNGLPQAINVGVTFSENTKAESSYHTLYKQVSATLSFFCATIASTFAYADLDDTAAKAFEGLHLLIEMIDEGLELKEVFEEKEHSCTYKFLQTLSTIMDEAFMIGFMVAMYDDKFADKEVTEVNGITITRKEFFPILAIAKKLSQVTGKSIRDLVKGRQGLITAIKEKLCGENNTVNSRSRIMKPYRYYSSFNNRKFLTFPDDRKIQNPRNGNVQINTTHEDDKKFVVKFFGDEDDTSTIPNLTSSIIPLK